MMFKKSWLVALALGAAFTTQAQKVNVQSAYNELKNGSLAKAKDYIDQAVNHPETQNWDKTYLYRGQIYAKVNADAELKAKAPNALDIAGESFLKCRELDKKGKYADDVAQGLAGIYGSMIDMAIRASEKKDYPTAVAGFEGAMKYHTMKPSNPDASVKSTTKITGPDGKTTTINQETNISVNTKINSSNFDPQYIRLVDNAAYYARLGKIYDKAELYYTQMTQTDSVKPYHFGDLANIYKEQKKNDAYLKTLEAGIAKFPGNYDLMVEEINAYIEMNKLPDAITKLLKAHDLNPKNVAITEVLANAYEKAKDMPNAIKYYQEALATDPKSYFSNYNMGAIIVTDAAKMMDDANKIPTSKTKEYEAAVVKVNDKLKTAIPYLEAAIASKAGDIDGMDALRKIYVKLNMMDKASALKKEIDAAKANKGAAR
jgi:tetratricopeptide (TPR) repeat protein